MEIWIKDKWQVIKEWGRGGQGVPVSPFAPVDLPDLNSIPTPGAVPPMVGVNVNIPDGF